MIVLKGIGVSDGISIARCYVLDRQRVRVPRYNISDEEVINEMRKLDDAISRTSEHLDDVRTMGHEALGEDHAFIFDVYDLLLKDDMLIGETRRVIERDLINAEFALRMVSAKIIRIFEKSPNEYFRERKHDIEQIVEKLLRFMIKDSDDSVDAAEPGDIIIAHDLSPSDATMMAKKRIGGFAINLGSKVSHTSIIARSIGITAVVGLEEITEHAAGGETVIIDGFEGVVIVDPNPDVLDDYRNKGQRYQNYKSELQKLSDVEVLTTDGVAVTLEANVELNEEITIAVENGAEGVGLYRTEFIYLEKGDISEQDQYDILLEAVKMNGGRPLVIRTFDLGGEKLSEVLPHPEERNPALGLRAIRYSLRFADFFKKQLRALLRLAVHGDVRILLPMISGPEEVRQAKKLIRTAAAELAEEGMEHRLDVPVGVMVELPSLALVTHLISKEVDFFSVGTNDLIQYTLGIDRNNEYVAYLYRPTHPAVLVLLEKIMKSAKRAKIPATVCGEMAGEPRYIPVLLGLGYRNLSMNVSSILKAKMIIRRLDIESCRKLVASLKRCKTARISEERLSRFIEDTASDVYFH